MLYLSVFTALLGVRFVGRNYTYGATIIGLFLFAAFRHHVGCDWVGYYYQHYVFSQYDLLAAFQTTEPLWGALIIFQNWIGLDYPWLNVWSAAIFFWGVHALARRQPDPLGFLILLFPVLILNMPMSGVRQGAAIGILCFAFLAFSDRKLIRFLVLVALASGIHSGASVMFILAPFVYGEYSRVRLIACAILAVPVGFLLLSSEGAEVAISRYLGTDQDASGAIFRAGFLALSGVAYYVFLRSRWQEKSPEDFKLVHLGALGMVALLLIVPISSIIGDRIGYFFIVIQALIFARLPFLGFQRGERIIVALPYLASLLFLLSWVSLSDLFWACYVPYDSWIFGVPEGGRFQLYLPPE